MDNNTVVPEQLFFPFSFFSIRINVFTKQSEAFSTKDPALQQHFQVHKRNHVLSYVACVAETTKSLSKWAARSILMVFTADFKSRFRVSGKDSVNTPLQKVELTQHQICKVNPHKKKHTRLRGLEVRPLYMQISPTH